MANETLTRTELMKAVGCPYYVIDYLVNCQRLPIIQESKGRGYPTLYHPDAIKVIKDHLAKRNA